MKQPSDRTSTAPIHVDFASLGMRIRNARAAQKLSLREIAARAKVSYSTVQRIENGQDSLQLDMIISVLNVLKIDLREFISGVGDRSESESNDDLVKRLAAEGKIPAVLSEIGKFLQESAKEKIKKQQT